MAGDSPDSRDVESRKAPPPKKGIKLPAWLNHFNCHDLKIVLRCSVAAWVATLLIVIQPALLNIGIATFFGALVLFIVPPASILFVYLLGSLSLLFGMCLAWAWGLLTMKAAQSAPPSADRLAKLQEWQQAAAAQANQTGLTVTQQAQILVYEGYLLDARITVVYYVMACIFIYALARFRCANPKMVLLQIFGTIITDLFLLIGPLLPTWQPKLASILIKPGAIGAGLGAACSILFFPQSTSFVVLGNIEKVVLLGQKALDTTTRRLREEDVSADELRGYRASIIGLYKASLPLIAFLPVDFSRGRWNADDVKGLVRPVREAMLAALSIIDFHIQRIDALEKEEKIETQHAAQAANEKGALDIGHHQLQESADLMHALRYPEQAEMRNRTTKALRDSTADLLQECSESIALAAKSIHLVNNHRWLRQPKQAVFDELAEELRTKVGAMQASRAKCATETTEKVLQSHADLFDQDGQLKAPGERGTTGLRGIVVSMVIEERILSMGVAMEKVLGCLLHLAETRKVHRIWFPTKLQYALSWLFNGRLSVPVTGNGEDTSDPDSQADPVVLQQHAEEARRRLRIATGKGARPKQHSALNRAVVGTYRWLTNPDGMYALRMVIVTIATSIPASLPHTSGFFYREKGIWGVITAQTTLLVYMADFTFSVLSRGLGTVLGGVLGMVAWYIGSGSGQGNPYGLGAIGAVMAVIIIWLRIFLPPAWAQATIMTGATYALVFGFSYDTHHVAQYGLPGAGYVAFWKRLVTVLLGFVAATVVQVFPKPPSATNHVSKTLANTVRTLADHYAFLLSHWGRPSPVDVSGIAEEITIGVADSLMGLSAAIGLLKIEISHGPFNHALLLKTQQQCQFVNSSIGRLLDLSTSLPAELQQRFVQTVGFMDDRSIGDTMAVFGTIEYSLRTGAPLPERLPAPLVRNFYDWWQQQHRNAMLSTALVRDENYRRYCVAVSAYLKLLATLDDLVLILKEGLGECHVVRRWDDAV